MITTVPPFAVTIPSFENSVTIFHKGIFKPWKQFMNGEILVYLQNRALEGVHGRLFGNWSNKHATSTKTKRHFFGIDEMASNMIKPKRLV